MKPYIIGIAGGSASGKSTFADLLSEKFNDVEHPVFHMDSYFKDEEKRPIAVSKISGKEYRDDNNPDSFDFSALKRDLYDARNSDLNKLIIKELRFK